MYQQLNLDQLETLCNLPCIIDDSRSLFEVALLQTATSNKPCKFNHYVSPGETLVTFLKRVYPENDKYCMDCSLYAQLASLVLSDKWPINGGKITLFIDDGEHSGHKLWRKKIPQMGYISVSDEEVCEALMRLPITFKGQWGIQIEKDKILGLTTTGPKIMNVEEWVSHLYEKLIEYSSVIAFEHDLFGNNVLDTIGRTIIHCYAKLGRMNQWGFYPFKGFATIKATKTSTGFEILHIEDIGEILSRRIGDLLGEMKKISKLLYDDPQMKKFSPHMEYATFDGYHSEDDMILYAPRISEEDTILPISRLSILSLGRFNEVRIPSIAISCRKPQITSDGILVLPTTNLFSSSHNETTISNRFTSFKETNKFQQTRKQIKNQNKNTRMKGRPTINRFNSGR